MSVPVPMAMPRSAWASAAASLMPSPTIATTRPCACSRATSSTLSVGSASATTVVIPTVSATARAAPSPSPVRSTGSSPSLRSSAIASALVGLIVSDRTSTARARPAQARATVVRPRRRGVRERPLQGVGKRDAALLQQAGPPSRTSPPPITPCMPSPSSETTSRTSGGGVHRLLGGVAGDRLRHRVRRRCGQRPGHGEHLVAILAVDGHDVGHGHLAGRDRAGLVEHDRVDPPGGLEHRRPGDEHAELRGAAGADQQRGGRGEPERARAGDDQDRGGGGECRARSRAGAGPEPPGGGGEHEHHRHELAADTVGEPLHGGLPGLRALDEGGRLRELGVGPDSGGPHDEAPSERDAPADHVIARCDVDGRRFPGDRRRVDRAGARRPPHRRWPPSHPAAPRRCRRRRAGRPARGVPARRRRTRASVAASASRPRSAAPERRRARRLQVAPGEHERRHPGGDLEVDLTRRRPLGASVRSKEWVRPGRPAVPNTMA